MSILKTMDPQMIAVAKSEPPEPAVFYVGVVEGCLRGSKGGILLTLRISPGAKKTSIEGLHGKHSMKMKVAAPPLDGKANAEIEHFLSELLGVPRSRVSIVKGATGRDKVVRLQDIDLEEAQEKLAPSAA